MKNRAYLIAAACVVSGGFLSALADDPRSVDLNKSDARTIVSDKEKGMEFVLPPGIAKKDLNANRGVERAITDVSEAALSKNGFDNVIGWLADQDKNRLSDKANMNVDDLNGLVDKINTNFKNKYGKEFKADNKSLDSFITILTGEVTDPNLLVGKWPVDAVVPTPQLDKSKSSAEKAADKVVDATKGVDMKGKVTPSDADIAKNKMFGGVVNLEKGRNVALVRFPMSHGLPAITASMIDEKTSWRFDIPNTITADQLHSNLNKTLTTLANRTDWPADMYEAQREVCHHIVAALYGVDKPLDSIKTMDQR